MRIDIITIFPEYFAPLGVSLIGKAAQRGDIEFGVHDLRAWSHDAHHSVDDAPFGGGPGMVLRPDVLDAAIDGAGGVGPLIHLSPRGRPLDQKRVRELAMMPGVRLICGRFEASTSACLRRGRSRR